MISYIHRPGDFVRRIPAFRTNDRFLLDSGLSQCQPFPSDVAATFRLGPRMSAGSSLRPAQGWVRRSSAVRISVSCAEDRSHELEVLIAAGPPTASERVTSGLQPLDFQVALSPFEERVLVLIAEGESDKEIARRLCCSVDSIKRAVRQVLVRLAARNRTEAAVRAVLCGLIMPGDAGSSTGELSGSA